MDGLPDLQILSLWLVEYGAFFLFGLLALGIIALPIPEETLMVVAGILMRHDKLSPIGTMIAALCGSICGISLSYLLGKTAGIFIITKYGKWIGLTHKRYQKAHNWIEKFGPWALFFGYFIPGVRHFTGLLTGATKLEFRKFMVYAYTGALLWVSTFLSFGYFFGHYGLALYEKLELTFDKAILLLLGLLLLIGLGLFFYFLYKRRK